MNVWSKSFEGLKSMNKYWFLLQAIVVVFFCGCSLTPKYTRPNAPVPTDWPSGASYKNTSDANNITLASVLPWKEFITDERLQKIIETALQNNRDLRVAALNVEKTRSLYGIQRAELWPTLNAIGSGSKQHIPGDLSGTGDSMTTEQYSVNLGIISWELDFFGRIRSLKEAALEQYFATEQGRRSVQILIISEVANAYLTYAADQESLKLAQSTLEAQEAAYNLIRRRLEIGLSPELDLYQVQTRVDAARVDVIFYTRLVAQDETTLNLLVGTSVLNDLLPDTLNSIGQTKEISVGISSEVLLSRPDILAAESQLKAINANIGAARAAFFPRVSLTTSIGTASGELSDLFKSGQDAWSFAPQIVMPIFDTRLKSALEVTKTDQEIAVALYEKSIQQAFKEVADALAVQGTVKAQLLAQQSLVNSVSETYRLSNTLYTSGIVSYLDVIDAQRSLYSAQQGLVSLRLARLANQIRLYTVLGGGNDSNKIKEP